ncbi:hypothetical protein, partial [Thiolapillus sp.]|uniref:hypothetical protein n=1 Tax=Thiolapillus sp. TaxID=2017437 RepID=UPI003AF8EF1A
SFSSYVQQYNRKQLNQLIFCPFDARKLAGGKSLIKKCSCNPASAELSLCMLSSPGWVFPHTAPKKLGMVGKTLFNYNFEE